MTISRGIHFITAEFMKNRNAATFAMYVWQVIQTYKMQGVSM